MNDQQEQRSGLPGMPEPDKREEPRTMSLMGGIAKPEGLPAADDFEFVDSAGGASKLLGPGTLIILAVFAVAAGTLYAMRLSSDSINTTTVSTEVEGRIDTWLAKVANPAAMSPSDPLQPQNMRGLFNDTEAILSTFQFDTTEHQVPIEFVQKNPFEMATTHVATPQISTAERDRELLLRRLQQEFNGLKLQSVMLGSRRIAVINGELKQVGQDIGSFRIDAIEGHGVALSAEGETFRLTQTQEIQSRR